MGIDEILYLVEGEDVNAFCMPGGIGIDTRIHLAYYKTGRQTQDGRLKDSAISLQFKRLLTTGDK
jgi:hypothetical protein